MLTWKIDAYDQLSARWRTIDVTADTAHVDHGVLQFHDAQGNLITAFGAGSWSACVLVVVPQGTSVS